MKLDSGGGHAISKCRFGWIDFHGLILKDTGKDNSFSHMSRVINFSAGPSALPLPVLEQMQKDLLNWENTGMSVMEYEPLQPSKCNQKD